MCVYIPARSTSPLPPFIFSSQSRVSHFTPQHTRAQSNEVHLERWGRSREGDGETEGRNSPYCHVGRQCCIQKGIFFIHKCRPILGGGRIIKWQETYWNLILCIPCVCYGIPVLLLCSLISLCPSSKTLQSCSQLWTAHRSPAFVP